MIIKPKFKKYSEINTELKRELAIRRNHKYALVSKNTNVIVKLFLRHYKTFFKFNDKYNDSKYFLIVILKDEIHYN